MQAQIEEARGDPPEDTEWPEIDRTTLPIRVPDDILYRLLKKKLLENAFRNRGYILDGFPRTHKDAKYCFLYRPVKLNEEGEPEEPEEEELEEGQEKTFDGYVQDPQIMPASCIVLKGEDKALTNRVMSLTEEQILGTHYSQKDMERRLNAYRVANNSQVAEPSVQDFFKNQGISVFEMAHDTPTEFALNAFKIYIERVSCFII